MVCLLCQPAENADRKQAKIVYHIVAALRLLSIRLPENIVSMSDALNQPCSLKEMAGTSSPNAWLSASSHTLCS
jgi:hypothetical protein